MKTVLERVRLFFIGKGKTKVGFAVFILLGSQVLFWPLSVLERIYLGSNEPAVSGPATLLLIGVLAMGGVYIVTFIHLGVWIWASIALYLHKIEETWIAIVFYVLMVISLVWIATLWWSDDVDGSLFKKQ